jgi:hypothetical protein
MTLNLAKLNIELREIETKIRALKKVLRTTWTRSMGLEQWQLTELKAESTQRYILRAWARGRYHLADHDRCKEVADQLVTQYPLAA